MCTVYYMHDTFTQTHQLERYREDCRNHRVHFHNPERKMSISTVVSVLFLAGVANGEPTYTLNGLCVCRCVSVCLYIRVCDQS